MLPGVVHSRRRIYLGAISSDDRQNSWVTGKPRRAVPFADCGSPRNLMARPITLYQTDRNDNDKLHEAILEARERLEERLRAPSVLNKRDSHVRLINNREQVSVGGLIAEARQPSELIRDIQPTSVATSKTCIDLLRKEIYVPETKGGKSWLKLKSRASEKEDCAVCLECFKLNQVLIHLPCGHKFHSSCLMPWLDNNQHCPYCRAKVSP